MLEQSIERLTVEVQKLREVIERQDVLLRSERASIAVRVPDSAPPPRTGAAYIDERAVAELIGVSLGYLRRCRLFKNGPPLS